MPSCGSLVFYGKKGISDPYPLRYGKTTIGSSTVDDIRIIGDYNISCELVTNELGVTTLINTKEDQNVLVNNAPSKMYTLICDGDFLEFGKIKLKYSHPYLEKKYLEKTQQDLDKRCGKSENVETNIKILASSSIPLGRLPNINSNKRRFSTGSKLLELKNTPKNKKNNIILSNKTSTPLSAPKTRFSQRIISRRNSSLAAVKENEEFDHYSSITNIPTSPILKKRSLILTAKASPLAKKNETFSGYSHISTPLLSKNKTYSGNVSDISENVTTPENNVSAASITPLNVSKKKRNTLNRSSRLSYVDFPNSSTPKSAMKTNRSSSVYRPLVEDITLASPLPRSSLRNSSLKKSAFTQRRSVNFNISSASESSSGQGLLSDVERERSFSERKRKRSQSTTELSENVKKFKEDPLGLEEDHNSSVQDSSLSGIQDLSDISAMSNKVSDTYELEENLSSRKKNTDLENQTALDEDPQSSPNQNLKSASPPPSLSSKSKRLNVSAQKKLKMRSKSLNLRIKRESLNEFSKSLANDMIFDLSKKSTLSEDIISLKESDQNSKNNQIKTSFIRTRSKSLGTRRNSISEIRSESSFVRISSSGINQHFITRKSLRSPISSPSDSSNKYSSSTIPEEVNESRKITRKSSSRISTIHSNLDNSKEISNFEKINDSQGKSDSMLSVISYDDYGSNNISSNGFSSEDNGNTEKNVSTVSGVSFKTPKGKTPRKLNYSNNTSKIANFSSDVRSAEKLLDKSVEDSSKSWIVSSDLTGDGQSESVNESIKSTSDVPVSSFQEFDVDSSTSKIPSPMSGIEDLMKISQTNLLEVPEVRELIKTPKTKNSTKVQNSPMNDLTDVRGVKNLLKTPKVCKSPKNDLTNITGVKRLLRTPKIQKSPNNDLSNVEAVKKLLRTPKVQKSPYNDLTNVGGIKKLLKTPKLEKSPLNDLSEIRGVKTLLRTPKVQKSPKNDLSNIMGLKKILKTPKVQKSPRNDLSNINGVKTLLRTPKVQKSPKNDLTNIAGIKKLLRSPKPQKSPKNDLSHIVGVKKLLRSPKVQKSPKNDLSDIKGVKQIFTVPKLQKEPHNDLMDVRGIRQLLRTPKNKSADESHDLSGIDILFNEPEDNFDKLLGKKPFRTYGKSPKTNQVVAPETSDHVIRWLEDQSKIEHTSQKPEHETKMEKLELISASDASLEFSPIKPRHKLQTRKKNEETTKEPVETPTNSSTNKRKAKKGVSNDRPSFEKSSEVHVDGGQEEKPGENKTKQARRKKGRKEESTEPTTETKISTRSRTRAQKIEEKIEPTVGTKESTRIRTRGQININEFADKTGNGNSQNSETPIKKKPVRSTRRRNKDSVSANETLSELNSSLQGDKGEINSREVKRTRGRKEVNEKNVETVERLNKGTRNRTRTEIGINDSHSTSGNEDLKDSENKLASKTKQLVNVGTKTTKRRGKNSSKEAAENATLGFDEENKSEPPKKKTKTKVTEAFDIGSTTLHDHNDTEEMKEVRSTRSNKGKNKKYNEEEWDTPVKREVTKRHAISKENVESVQTSENTGNIRNLRRRNIKKEC